MDTAERIFRLLDQSGMEQKKFAELIGATDKVVSKWRTAGLKSYRKYLPQIAEVLETTVEYLVTGENKTPAGQEADGREKEFAQLFGKLTPEQQDLVIAQLRGVVGSQDK